MLKIPQIKGKDIIRPAVFDGRTGYYTAKDKYVSSGELAINSTDFKRGLDARSRSYVILQGERLENYHVEGSERVYNQPYSIVYGNYYTRAVRDRDGKIWGLTNYTNGGANGYGTNLITKDQNYAYFNVDQIAGQATPASEIPTIGKATYGGGAFTGTGEGGLSYTVDFGKRTGSGSLYVSDIAGTVVLHEGEIVSTTGGGVAEKGIKGVASLADTQYKGNYELGFYGPNAAEIAGKATMTAESYLIKAPSNTLGSVIIGFGGTRGTITK
ncbi:factor H binding protein domain-containing protein [Moraxella pluranimalium]|nr:factor H binding protein domain-containing protein [Moraxella pluranimalium]